MAGFALAIDVSGRIEQDFDRFLQSVARHKSLTESAEYAYGENCIGAKLDSLASLHRGITVDQETGSWMIAAGTVIDTLDVPSDGDLSLLLKDYLAQGKTVFGRCDGLFGLVIYNGLTRGVSVVSDPFGYFSVFYGRRNGQVFVATSALAVAQAVRSKPNEIGVKCFLHTGQVFGDMTLWSDVNRLLPATVLEFTGETVCKSTYWAPTVDDSVTQLSFADSIGASMETLERVFRRNLSREGKLWTDLTGGFDTRLMTMILERTGIPFKANFVGSPEHPDVKIAHTIAHTMSWEHQHFELPENWPQECTRYLWEVLGRGDAHLNVLLLTRPLWVHRQEQEQYTTLLSGLGGEMWRGPLWWPERANLGQSTTVHYDRQVWSLMHPIADSIFVADSSDQVREELVSQFRRVGERDPTALNPIKLDRIWVYRETGHAGAWTSFAAGLLRIIPALFSKDVLTYTISLDHRWRIRNHLVRHMFERYAPVLANVELEGGGPAIPARVTNLHRFLPRYIGFCQRAANKLGQIALGRSLWLPKSFTSYSVPDWRQEILEFALAEEMFQPAKMRSGNLYEPDQLQGFLSQVPNIGFRYDEFLGRIITVEMALRTVGTAID